MTVFWLFRQLFWQVIGGRARHTCMLVLSVDDNHTQDRLDKFDYPLTDIDFGGPLHVSRSGPFIVLIGVQSSDS